MPRSSTTADAGAPAPSRVGEALRGQLCSLQFLRFIAAALVVVSHVRTDYGLIPIGGIGVDVFFIISGFIIYYVTQTPQQHFLLRRVIRIVPLYWSATLALAAVAWAAPGALNSLTLEWPRLVASLLFIPYHSEAFNYQPLLLLGWTLNFEMLFYAVFFVAMTISHRHRFLICSLLLVALAISGRFAAPRSAHHFWADPIIIEFIFGMFVAVLVAHRQLLQRWALPLWAAALALVGFCLLATWMALVGVPEPLRFIAYGLPSLVLVMVFLLAEKSIRRVPQAVQRAIVYLGDLSYSTYIFHVYVLGALRRLLGGWELSIVPYTVLVFIATGVVAALAFRLIEVPSRIWLTDRLNAVSHRRRARQIA